MKIKSLLKIISTTNKKVSINKKVFSKKRLCEILQNLNSLSFSNFDRNFFFYNGLRIIFEINIKQSRAVKSIPGAIGPQRPQLPSIANGTDGPLTDH